MRREEKSALLIEKVKNISLIGILSIFQILWNGGKNNKSLNTINYKYISMTVAQEKRWKAEYEIIKKLGEVPSCRKMAQLLKDDYGIVANHNTINSDLKNDLETLSKEEYENRKSSILKMIDDEIDIAHGIATNDLDNSVKLKAMNTVSKLSKVKADILIKFRKAQAEQAKEEQATITVFIGEPKEIDKSKFTKLEGKNNGKNSEQD